MAKSFTQIMTWIEECDYPAGKAYLDEQGRPLTGFVMRETKNTQTMTLCGRGYYRMAYTIDKAIEPPIHTMIRWMNLTMCGGFFMKDEDGKPIDADAIATAVRNGLKPAGDLFYWQQDHARNIAATARELGFEVLEYQRDFPVNPVAYRVMIGDSRRIDEIFDLEKIANYYEAAVPYTVSALRCRYSEVAELTPIGALMQYDWVNPGSPSELIMTGMLLGYPFESTASLLR